MSKLTPVDKARQIVAKNMYLTIAVSSRDGTPWIANLFYAFDQDYNFYWYSDRNSVHSTFIRENPVVAMAIFDSRAVEFEDVDAVYLKAKAYEVSQPKNLKQAMQIYIERMIKTPLGQAVDKLLFLEGAADFLGDSPLRFYKAIPLESYKLDPGFYKDKFRDKRMKVRLPVSKGWEW